MGGLSSFDVSCASRSEFICVQSSKLMWFFILHDVIMAESVLASDESNSRSIFRTCFSLPCGSLDYTYAKSFSHFDAFLFPKHAVFNAECELALAARGRFSEWDRSETCITGLY